MIKLYDKVVIKKTNKKAVVIDIDNNNNTAPETYLVELLDKPQNFGVEDVLSWCEYDEIELCKE